MKTEISRNSRQKGKRYSGVYQQQGRMFTDSDVNEQTDINKVRLDGALGDVIVSGVPREGGLSITPDVKIQSGRIYIDGVAAEIPGDGALVELNAQTDFPSFPVTTESDYLLYADVWERTVTAIEDERLLDDGLHGADTCTRTQTMCQIKWCKPIVDPELTAQNPHIGSAELTLTLRAASTATDQCDPCADTVDVATRTGNYLFRVEVHDVQYVDDLPENGITSFTLKWSSENGAEQYAIGDAPDSFKQQRAYEFFNESSEKHLGVHFPQAADFPLRGELTAGYPVSPPGGFENVRRWDGYCEVDVSGNALTGGVEHGVTLSTANAVNSVGHVNTGATLSINLTAMKLQLLLDSKQLVAGDYWLGEVREDAVDRNALLPQGGTPEAIYHHYLTLAHVDAGNVMLVSNGDCKRHGFPPLNDIRATDVCYDNTTCEFPDAQNVQDALDNLCRQKGLKYHNKHLHGWGIVCGLQLECTPHGASDERQHIIIQKGSAIDCEGCDIILDHAQKYPVLELAGELAGVSDAIENNRDVDLCIAMQMGADGEPQFNLESYNPGDVKWKDVFSDTLLMDFYEECIKEPLDAIRNLLMPEVQQGELVTAADEQRITLTNMVIQLLDQVHGRYVYISPKEDLILRELHALLKEILSSKTYCAMYDGLPEFPDYPFPETPFSTVFGPIRKGREHDRLRVHPKGAWGYTLGGEDSHIHMFDLRQEKMIAEIAHPGGEGCVVQDVAFSPDGNHIYASALLDNKTVLAVGEMDGRQIKWADSKIICDLQLVTLATSVVKPFSVYAVAKGEGLYLIDPASAANAMTRIVKCNAVGHLLISDSPRTESPLAFLTVGNKTGNSDVYDEVRAIPLQQTATMANAVKSYKWSNFSAGEDDIAVAFDAENESMHLYVVSGLSNQATASGTVRDKQLLHFDVASGELINSRPLENTDIRLAVSQQAGQLLVSFADSYRLMRLDYSIEGEILEHHPVQLSPSSMAVAKKHGKIYVLNSVSYTISPIPAKPEDGIDIDALAQYRDDVLKAFSALTTGLVQYLKDCFCHHLLIKCPECSDEDIIYLGSISIRGGQVLKVCNFAKRKYVKSFPTIGYWMSILPIGRVLDIAVEKLCCAVIPDLFGKFGIKDQAAGMAISQNEKPAQKLRRYAYLAHNADVGGAVNIQKEHWRTIGDLGRQAIFTGIEQSLIEKPTGIGKTDLVGQPVEIARSQLLKRGVQVAEIKDYAPNTGLKNVSAFVDTPNRLAAGDQVTLYQKDGRVTFYAIQQEPAANTVITADSEAKVLEIEQRLGDLNAQTVVADEAIGKQRVALDALDQRRLEIAKAIDVQQKTDFSGVQTSIKDLQGQATTLGKSVDTQRVALDGIDKRRLEIGKAIDAQQKTDFSDVQTTIEKLQAQKNALTTALAEQASVAKAMQADIASLTKTRAGLQKQIKVDRIGYGPVSGVAGVGKTIEASFRELGIRTVSNLAQSDPVILTEKLNIPPARATRLVEAANKKLAV
ncbi:MAG: DUF6519 domain-containing protein [Mariprofundaceae bacterium]